MFTREHVHRFAAILFPDIPITLTIEHLDQYGSEPYEPERERVQMAILQLSQGNADLFHHNIAQAKQDYRDILYWAEYDKQDRRTFPKKPATTTGLSATSTIHIGENEIQIKDITAIIDIIYYIELCFRQDQEPKCITLTGSKATMLREILEQERRRSRKQSRKTKVKG